MIEQDYRRADLPENLRALMDYALKLTLTPGAMTEDSVLQLRELGYSDEQLLDATFVIGYFNFINRLADGLGVDIGPEMQKKPQLPPFSSL